MKTLRLIILAFVLAIPARAQVHLLVTTNGALLGPVDFFTLNSNLIVSAVGGAFGGGGTGNASTNATQAWAAGFTQTFLGPVYFGTTNAVTELAGKQNADAQLDVVANLTSGTATNFLAGDGTFKQVTTNMVPGLVADILAAAAAGGGGDVTLAGTNAFTGPNSFAGTTTFNGAANLNGTTTISNLTVPGTLTATSFSIGTPLGVASGGTGAGSAAAARTNLGLVIGYDVQAYDANLAQLATVSWSSGDVPYFDGANLTNLATTAAGRTLLTAANAAAQWSALLSSATTNGAYNSSTWDGITDRVPNLDQIRDAINALPGGSNSITSVNTNYFTMAGGYLDWVGGSTGGGSGYTYLLTNSVGAFQSRAASTNWVILSTTVSSNYAPSVTGKFLEGGYGLVFSNNSGTIGNLNMRIKANGTIVFQDAPASLTTGTLRAAAEDFRIVRESDTTASIVSVGSYVIPTASIGLGDFGGSSPLGNSKTITNIAWNWATNNSIEISVDCDTSTSTNNALGMTVIQAFLRAEGAAGGGGGTGDVVGPASSTDSVVALFDGTTGKLLKNGTLTEAAINAHLTEAEASALYQRTNSVLTTLATLNGSALTNLNASNLASGTMASNLLPAAVSFTTLNAGTINATAVVGDASGLTGINATNITAGTLPDARLSANVGLTNAVVLKAGDTMTGDLSVPDEAYGAGWDTSVEVPTKNAVYDQVQLRAPLASPALTGTPTVNGTNLMAAIASAGGGGGGLTLIDAAPITNVNFRSSWASKASVSSVTNVDWIPQPPTTVSSASLTPAFDSSRGHEFTLTNNATLNAPSGVVSGMVGDTFRIVFIQDATGGRTLTAATNYLFGSDITGLTLTTNAGARDYAVVYVRRTNVFDVVGFVRGYAQ